MGAMTCRSAGGQIDNLFSTFGTETAETNDTGYFLKRRKGLIVLPAAVVGARIAACLLSLTALKRP
jgi:hypothetical protein